MNVLLGWIIAVGLLWFTLTTGLTLYLAKSPPVDPQKSVASLILAEAVKWGPNLGNFIAPVLQVALIIMILIAAAERFGLTKDKNWAGFAALSIPTNVQAFIAVAIIGAVVIAALAGLDKGGVLKDLALVVVGFYFGTRRRQGEIEEAVAAGAAAGAAQQTVPPQVPPASENPPAQQ